MLDAMAELGAEAARGVAIIEPDDAGVRGVRYMICCSNGRRMRRHASPSWWTTPPSSTVSNAAKSGRRTRG